MKTSLSMIALACAALSTTAFAGTPAYTPSAPASSPSAGYGGFYSSIQGGALWLDDASLGPVDVEFDVGFSVTATFGYAFGNGFALELESGFLQADVDTVSVGGSRGFDFDGEFRQIPIFANAVYLAELTDRLGLYAGAGIGTIWSEFESNGTEGADSWNLGFQAKAGAAYKLTEAVSLNVGYRFLYGADAFSAGRYEDDSLSHVLEGGLTIRF